MGLATPSPIFLPRYNSPQAHDEVRLVVHDPGSFAGCAWHMTPPVQQLANSRSLPGEGWGAATRGRIDIRCDVEGRVNFLEERPSAGLNPDASDLPLLCRIQGISYQTLIEDDCHFGSLTKQWDTTHARGSQLPRLCVRVAVRVAGRNCFRRYGRSLGPWW
jgi:hypothetical protein